jgi:hypothetical protein
MVCLQFVYSQRGPLRTLNPRIMIPSRPADSEVHTDTNSRINATRKGCLTQPLSPSLPVLTAKIRHNSGTLPSVLSHLCGGAVSDSRQIRLLVLLKQRPEAWAFLVPTLPGILPGR